MKAQIGIGWVAIFFALVAGVCLGGWRGLGMVSAIVATGVVGIIFIRAILID